MTLEHILQQLHCNADIEAAVYKQIRANENSIQEKAKFAYAGELPEFPLCKWDPLTRLSVVIYLLLQKVEEYRADKIPDPIILNTFRDVSLRANLYFEKTKKAGISEDDVIWFRHLMNVNIFKIGSLQFQPFEMIYLDEETLGEAYMQFSQAQKIKLPAGTPVINCHVQQGTDLCKRSVEASFSEALTFFHQYYSSLDFKAFLCYSWLLYPPMMKLLKENSNIKYFAEKFTIISSCSDSEQAEQYLFSGYSKHTTSLQETWSQDKTYFGYACGIIEI